MNVIPSLKPVRVGIEALLIWFVLAEVVLEPRKIFEEELTWVSVIIEEKMKLEIPSGLGERLKEIFPKVNK